jgi:hypothetical protein
MSEKGTATPWRHDDIDEYDRTPRGWLGVEIDEDRAERHLAAEMRPLLETIQRLRDRDILD